MSGIEYAEIHGNQKPAKTTAAHKPEVSLTIKTLLRMLQNNDAAAIKAINVNFNIYAENVCQDLLNPKYEKQVLAFLGQLLQLNDPNDVIGRLISYALSKDDKSLIVFSRLLIKLGNPAKIFGLIKTGAQNIRLIQNLIALSATTSTELKTATKINNQLELINSFFSHIMFSGFSANGKKHVTSEIMSLLARYYDHQIGIVDLENSIKEINGYRGGVWGTPLLNSMLVFGKKQKPMLGNNPSGNENQSSAHPVVMHKFKDLINILINGDREVDDYFIFDPDSQTVSVTNDVGQTVATGKADPDNDYGTVLYDTEGNFIGKVTQYMGTAFFDANDELVYWHNPPQGLNLEE